MDGWTVQNYNPPSPKSHTVPGMTFLSLLFPGYMTNSEIPLIMYQAKKPREEGYFRGRDGGITVSS